MDLSQQIDQVKLLASAYSTLTTKIADSTAVVTKNITANVAVTTALNKYKTELDLVKTAIATKAKPSLDALRKSYSELTKEVRNATDAEVKAIAVHNRMVQGWTYYIRSMDGAAKGLHSLTSALQKNLTAILGTTISYKGLTDSLKGYYKSVYDLSRVSQRFGESFDDMQAGLAAASKQTTLSRQDFAALAVEVKKAYLGIPPTTRAIAEMVVRMQNLGFSMEEMKDGFTALNSVQKSLPDVYARVRSAQDAYTKSTEEGDKKLISIINQMRILGKTGAEIQNVYSMIKAPDPKTAGLMAFRKQMAETEKATKDAYLQIAQNLQPVLLSLSKALAAVANMLGKIPAAATTGAAGLLIVGKAATGLRSALTLGKTALAGAGGAATARGMMKGGGKLALVAGLALGAGYLFNKFANRGAGAAPTEPGVGPGNDFTGGLQNAQALVGAAGGGGAGLQQQLQQVRNQSGLTDQQRTMLEMQVTREAGLVSLKKAFDLAKITGKQEDEKLRLVRLLNSGLITELDLRTKIGLSEKDALEVEKKAEASIGGQAEAYSRLIAKYEAANVISNQMIENFGKLQSFADSVAAQVEKGYGRESMYVFEQAAKAAPQMLEATRQKLTREVISSIATMPGAEAEQQQIFGGNQTAAKATVDAMTARQKEIVALQKEIANAERAGQTGEVEKYKDKISIAESELAKLDTKLSEMVTGDFANKGPEMLRKFIDQLKESGEVGEDAQRKLGSLSERLGEYQNALVKARQVQMDAIGKEEQANIGLAKSQESVLEAQKNLALSMNLGMAPSFEATAALVENLQGQLSNLQSQYKKYRTELPQAAATDRAITDRKLNTTGVNFDLIGGLEMGKTPEQIAQETISQLLEKNKDKTIDRKTLENDILNIYAQQTQQLNKNKNEQLSTISKIANETKAIREGWLSFMKESILNAGQFAGIISMQKTGIPTLMRYGGPETYTMGAVGNFGRGGNAPMYGPPGMMPTGLGNSPLHRRLGPFSVNPYTQLGTGAVNDNTFWRQTAGGAVNSTGNAGVSFRAGGGEAGEGYVVKAGVMPQLRGLGIPHAEVSEGVMGKDTVPYMARASGGGIYMLQKGEGIFPPEFADFAKRANDTGGVQYRASGGDLALSGFLGAHGIVGMMMLYEGLRKNPSAILKGASGLGMSASEYGQMVREFYGPRFSRYKSIFPRGVGGGSARGVSGAGGKAASRLGRVLTAARSGIAKQKGLGGAGLAGAWSAIDGLVAGGTKAEELEQAGVGATTRNLAGASYGLSVGAGGLGGALGGAALGAGALSFAGPLGILIGGLAGGYAGYMGGLQAGEALGDWGVKHITGMTPEKIQQMRKANQPRLSEGDPFGLVAVGTAGGSSATGHMGPPPLMEVPPEGDYLRGIFPEKWTLEKAKRMNAKLSAQRFAQTATGANAQLTAARASGKFGRWAAPAQDILGSIQQRPHVGQRASGFYFSGSSNAIRIGQSRPGTIRMGERKPGVRYMGMANGGPISLGRGGSSGNISLSRSLASGEGTGGMGVQHHVFDLSPALSQIVSLNSQPASEERLVG